MSYQKNWFLKPLKSLWGPVRRILIQLPARLRRQRWASKAKLNPVLRVPLVTAKRKHLFRHVFIRILQRFKVTHSSLQTSPHTRSRGNLLACRQAKSLGPPNISVEFVNTVPALCLVPQQTQESEDKNRFKGRRMNFSPIHKQFKCILQTEIYGSSLALVYFSANFHVPFSTSQMKIEIHLALDLSGDQERPSTK